MPHVKNMMLTMIKVPLMVCTYRCEAVSISRCEHMYSEHVSAVLYRSSSGETHKLTYPLTYPIEFITPKLSESLELILRVT
jgi:hypothetical protein